jgi:transposase
VREVLGGSPIGEVAERYGTTRQSLDSWRKRVEAEGMPGLTDRSRRPKSSPSRVDAEIEAVICRLRRGHPQWGARRISFEFGRRGMTAVPGRAIVHRILARNGLMKPQEQRHGQKYKRWQRDAPMQLWHLDIVGGVPLARSGRPRLSPGSPTARGSSWSAPWSRSNPAGRSRRRSPRRCAAPGFRSRC